MNTNNECEYPARAQLRIARRRADGGWRIPRRRSKRSTSAGRRARFND